MRRPRRNALLFTGLVMAVAVPALAQQRAGDVHLTYDPSCDASKISKADTEKAIKLYNLAADFIRDSNYDNAVDFLKKAYETDCRAVEILLGLGTVFERAGNLSEAIRADEEYLRRVPNPPAPDTREVVERRIETWKRRLGATTTTASTAPTATTPPAATDAGAPPSSTATATVTAPPAAVDAGPPHVSSKKSQVGPVVTMVVGGAALATGIVVGIIGAGKVSTADKNCDPVTPGGRDCTNSSAVTDGNNGRTLEGVGVGVAIGGAVVAGLGLTWLILNSGSSTEQTTPAARLSPVVAPGYAGLSFGGRF